MSNNANNNNNNINQILSLGQWKKLNVIKHQKKTKNNKYKTSQTLKVLILMIGL